MINGAISQDAMCNYGWAQDNECKLCGGPGTEKHRLCSCKGWHQLRLKLEHKARLMEQINEDDSQCWLWDRGIVSCPGGCQTERVVSHEQACRSQFSWRFQDCAEAWNRNARSYSSRIAIDGSI